MKQNIFDAEYIQDLLQMSWDGSQPDEPEDLQQHSG